MASTMGRIAWSGALAFTALGAAAGLLPAAATAAPAPKPNPFAGSYHFTRTHWVSFHFFPQSVPYLVDWDVTIATDGTLSGSGTGFVSFDRLGVHYEYQIAGTLSGSMRKRGHAWEGSFVEDVRNSPYVAPKVGTSFTYSFVCWKDGSGDLLVSRNSQTPEVWTRQ